MCVCVCVCTVCTTVRGIGLSGCNETGGDMKRGTVGEGTSPVPVTVVRVTVGSSLACAINDSVGELVRRSRSSRTREEGEEQ